MQMPFCLFTLDLPAWRMSSKLPGNCSAKPRILSPGDGTLSDPAPLKFPEMGKPRESKSDSLQFYFVGPMDKHSVNWGCGFQNYLGVFLEGTIAFARLVWEQTAFETHMLGWRNRKM